MPSFKGIFYLNKFKHKNMYNITKGQLIVVWIAGIIVELFLLFIIDTTYPNSEPHLFLFLMIPFILIFYTLGWKSRNIHKNV